MGARLPTRSTVASVLTKREMDVIDLVAQGETNRFIAQHLGISDETVKRHVSNVLDKRGLDNRAQLAVWWTLRAQYERDTLAVNDRAAELQELDMQIGQAHRLLATLRRKLDELAATRQTA